MGLLEKVKAETAVSQWMKPHELKDVIHHCDSTRVTVRLARLLLAFHETADPADQEADDLRMRCVMEEVDGDHARKLLAEWLGADTKNIRNELWDRTEKFLNAERKSG